MELNENTIVSLSGLLNSDKETVIKALTSEDGNINALTDNLVIRSKEDAQKYELNLLGDFKKKHIDELKDKAKRKELDPELYNFFKGNVAGEFERKISDAFNINEYNGFDDLLTKIKSGKSTDESIKKMVTELQERNTVLATEKEQAIKEAQGKFESELLKMKSDAIYNSLALDYEGEAATKQKQLLKNTIAQTYDFRIENNNIVTYDKNGMVLKDANTLEPVAFSKVVNDIAKAYDFKIKSPESGGQGGQSSRVEVGQGVSFDDYLKTKGVKPLTMEADKLYVDWRKINNK